MRTAEIRGSPLGVPLSRFAVPSWAIPGGIAENARFLAGRAAEVGLCFFETEACLAYGRADLPDDLAGLPLTWHVHLPLDLPWAAGLEDAASVALRLMDKVAFLNARRAVLHLPVGLAQGKAPAAMARAWENFVTRWRDSGRASQDILLENQIGDGPQVLLGLAQTYDLGLCLDFSHWLLTYGPQTLPGQEFLQRVGLTHINAPGSKGTGHAALTEFLPDEQDWAVDVLHQLALCRAQGLNKNLQDNALIMLEIFSWKKIVASLPCLRACLPEI